MYDNRYWSVLMFRSRTNTLKLGWRNRFVGGNVQCPLCGAEEETLQHFLKECERLRGVRINQQIEEDTPLEEILLFKKVNDRSIRKYHNMVPLLRGCGV
jgi:hypothetical protein